MPLYQAFIMFGIAIVIAGFVITVLPNSNRTVGCITLGLGVVFVGVGVVYKSFGAQNQYTIDTSRTVTIISNEVGMDAINTDSKTIEKLNNNTDCNVFFKDGDNIYLCDVKYENGQRNYYFSSEGKTIPLLKADGSTTVTEG